MLKRITQVAVVLTLIGCASRPVVREPVLAGREEPREMSPDSQIVHALNRLTYGARPKDVEAVKREGLDRWLVRQLTPENWPDVPGDSVNARYPVLQASVKELADSSPQQGIFVRRRRRELGLPDTARYALSGADSVQFRTMTALGNRRVNQYLSAKLAHAVVTDHQLEELMVDFWENHFSVFRGKMPTPFALMSYDRDVIRPHAMGKFRDLLGAVAHSPAMLWYLDNYQSSADSARTTLASYRAIAKAKTAADSARLRAAVLKRRGGLNENYGRELLELHTLGVDGGYTQSDVINVARALTGWGLKAPVEGGDYAFNPGAHDASEKLVLGHVLPAGRGEEDGEEVMDIAARHPATGRFIATKLVRHFVADDPPAALVQRATDTFRQTDGDIRQVMAVIVSSPEFYRRSAFRAKVKTPYEVVVSAYRVLGGIPDTAGRSLGYLNQLGAPMYGHLTPEGWPDAGEGWLNTGSLLNRINFGANLAAGRVLGVSVARAFDASVRSEPADRQVADVEMTVLGGEPSATTRELLGESPGGRVRPSFVELLGIALGSPDFQRR